MSIKQIVNRLRDISRDAWSQDHNRMPQMGRELDGVITDLRALDGKTVLPVEVVEAIEAGDTLYIESGVDGGHCVGTILAMLEHAHGNGIGLTPAAAIDALAEEIRRNP